MSAKEKAEAYINKKDNHGCHSHIEVDEFENAKLAYYVGYTEALEHILTFANTKLRKGEWDIWASNDDICEEIKKELSND